MKSQAITENFQEANVDALAVAVFKDEKAASGLLKDLDELTGGHIASVIKTEEFKGETGETAYFLFAPKGQNQSEPAFTRRCRRKKRIQSVGHLRVSGTATRYFRKRNVKSFALLPRSKAMRLKLRQLRCKAL